MSAIRIAVPALAAALTASAAQAASVGLDVKTGLWEMTSSGETSGAPPVPALPPEVLAQLTPAQRAQMKGAMAAGMQQSGKRRVRKQCVTEETLKRGIALDDKPKGNCRETIVSNTATVMEMRLQCSGSMRGDGTYRFEAVSREQVRGTVVMKVGNGGNTMTMKRVMSGRWLGPDCGNVRPK
jgi:hypothetical protein